MKICEIAEKLGLVQVTELGKPATEVVGGYTSDLLSNVMGQAQPGMVWVTMQGHKNIAAVGSLIGLAAIIISSGVKAEEAAVIKANENNLPIYSTELSSYEIAGRLYELGVGKKD